MRDFSFPGRSSIIAKNAMIATSHPIATAHGLCCLAQGGSAIDAALCASATLTLAEPHMTGIGGDCFALVKPTPQSQIIAINGSGYAPQQSNLNAIQKKCGATIPALSPHAVTIPGAINAWWKLHQKYGKLDWEQIFQPAIKLASDGVAIHERVAFDWSQAVEKLHFDQTTQNLYLKNGDAFKWGDVFANPKLAKTYRHIAKHGSDGFYKGWVCDDLLTKLTKMGGLHQESDFSGYEAQFVTPIKASYKDFTLWECPPNGQGVTALAMLKIIERFDLKTIPPIDYIHLMAEAGKLAYQIRDQWLGDTQNGQKLVDQMLDPHLIKKLAGQINFSKTLPFAPSDFPTHQDTIYLSVVDQDGMAISFINSIFDSFGSAITAPESGILLHSRGRSFKLEEGHPNAIAPLKRPLHTIIPAMVANDLEYPSDPLPFGVMGGQYQAFGHAHLISNIADKGLDIQNAINAPRAFSYDGFLELESGHDKSVYHALTKRGHRIHYPAQPIGGAQAIMRNKQGFLIGASDPRKDGMAAGF
ncbi:MAG: gamma-glutamyltransferase [Pseudomonadota bacterium]